MNKQTVVIIGGGITGLVAAYYLSATHRVILLEKEKNYGGMSTSFEHKDFILDYGPHKIYSQLPGIIEEIKKVCPLLKVKKKNSIYLKNNYFDFPLSLKQIAMKMPTTALKAGIDILVNIVRKRPDISYENFLSNRFGKTLYELSFKDYAQKVWQSKPSDLDSELARRRVAVSGIFQLIKSIILRDSNKISAEFFYYPRYGISELVDSLVKIIKKNEGEILTNAKIEEIKTNGDRIISVKVKETLIKPDFIISTIALNDLVPLIYPKPEAKTEKAAKSLSYTSTNIIYFLIKKPKVLTDNWVFFPEKKFLFHRISEQKAFSRDTCPAGKTALMVETTKKLNKDVLEDIKNQLIGLNLFKKKDIEELIVKKLNKAYPLYSIGFKKNLDIVLAYLDKIENFLTVGRPGLFNYNNMDQCWDMAFRASQHIENKKDKKDWLVQRRYFDRYKIVD